MMQQLTPFFRIVPVLLFVFGIILTGANIVEVRATSSQGAMGSTFYGTERTIYLVAIIRSFYDLFFLWGMAALVAAANRYLDQEDAV